MRNLFRKEPSYVSVPGKARAASEAQVGDGLWVRCDNERCRELLYVREFENNLKVCQKCQHHARLNMYIAQSRSGQFEIVERLGVIDPQERLVGTPALAG